MKAIKITGIAILIFIAVIFGVATWVWTHPHETWKIVEAKILPLGMKISWQDLQVRGKYLSGLNFYLDWQMKGLLIQNENPELNIPIDEIFVKATISPISKSPKVEVHEVGIKSSQPISLKSDSSAKNPFQNIQQALVNLKNFFNWIEIEELVVDVKEIRLTGEDGSLTSVAAMGNKKILRPLEFTIQIHSSLKIGIEGQLDLGQKNFLTSEVTIEGLGIQTKQSMEVAGSADEFSIHSAGAVRFTKGKLKIGIEPDIRLKLTPNKALLDINTAIEGISESLAQMNNVVIHVESPLEKNVVWSAGPTKFTVSAPVGLFFIDKNMRSPLEKYCECKVPEVLLAKASGEAWLQTLLNSEAEKKPALNAHLEIEGVENKLVSIDFSADMRIDKQNGDYFFAPRVDLKASVNSYQGMRRFLDARGVLIPSPFDILEGTIEFKASGPVDFTDNKYVFPLHAKAHLKSSKQLVNLSGEFKARINKQFNEMDLDIAAIINDFQIELPPLDPLAGMPRVLPDQRILRKPPVLKKSESKFKLSVSFDVETKPGSIRLLSKYFDPFLPLEVKFRNNRGYVNVSPFYVQYLRRRVHVEKMKIDFEGAERKIYPVSGRLSVKQTQYMVFIDIGGTTEKPIIVFSSDPYLPQDQIISVLLYDRTTGEEENAGNFQAAVADRAIGLFGLWAFAATPIRSFNYNPTTKIYSASVVLGNEVTAAIGTNWEEATRLELRKRVSKNWILTATWDPATLDTEQTQRLELMWEKRF